MADKQPTQGQVKDKTFGEVVREYFPDATDDEIGFILWEKTGYPCFWETDDTETCLRKQLQEFKDNIATGKGGKGMTEQDGGLLLDTKHAKVKGFNSVIEWYLACLNAEINILLDPELRTDDRLDELAVQAKVYIEKIAKVLKHRLDRPELKQEMINKGEKCYEPNPYCDRGCHRFKLLEFIDQILALFPDIEGYSSPEEVTKRDVEWLKVKKTEVEEAKKQAYKLAVDALIGNGHIPEDFYEALSAEAKKQERERIIADIDTNSFTEYGAEGTLPLHQVMKYPYWQALKGE